MLYQNLTVRPVLFGVAGDKNTGKTTLMEELIRRLTNRGWKVAAIKEHESRPEMGSETYL